MGFMFCFCNCISSINLLLYLCLIHHVILCGLKHYVTIHIGSLACLLCGRHLNIKCKSKCWFRVVKKIRVGLECIVKGFKMAITWRLDTFILLSLYGNIDAMLPFLLYLCN